MYRYEKQLCFIQGSLDITLRKCRENTRWKINLHKTPHWFIIYFNKYQTEYEGIEIEHQKNARKFRQRENLFYSEKFVWSKDVILKEILSIQDRQHFGSAFVICSELDPEPPQSKMYCLVLVVKLYNRKILLPDCNTFQ